MTKFLEKIERSVNVSLIVYSSFAFIMFFFMPKNELTGVVELWIVIPAAIIAIVTSIFRLARIGAGNKKMNEFMQFSFIVLIVAALSFLMQSLRDWMVLNHDRKEAYKVLSEYRSTCKGDVDCLRDEVRSHDNPLAKYELGCRYVIGWGVERDVVGYGLPLLKSAAEQMYQPAQIGSGKIYRYGNGVEPDLQEAEEWYRKAFQLGNIAGHSYGFEAGKELLNMYLDHALYVKAYDVCNELIEEYPIYADSIYYKKALVYVGLNQLKKAEEWAYKAFYDKNIACAGLVLANIYIADGRLHEAEEILLNRAKQRDRDAQRKLSELYKVNGQEEAAEFWHKVSLLNLKELEELSHVR